MWPDDEWESLEWILWLSGDISCGVISMKLFILDGELNRAQGKCHSLTPFVRTKVHITWHHFRVTNKPWMTECFRTGYWPRRFKTTTAALHSILRSDNELEFMFSHADKESIEDIPWIYRLHRENMQAIHGMRQCAFCSVINSNNAHNLPLPLGVCGIKCWTKNKRKKTR